VFDERILESELTSLWQQRDGHAGEHLINRGQVELGIDLVVLAAESISPLCRSLHGRGTFAPEPFTPILNVMD
jgi:hypothetical protein